MAAQVYEPRDTESAEINELYQLFLREKTPALIGPSGESIPIPESIYDILLRVIGYMSQGKGVSVIPVMQELTTQHAANMLGVSRPFFVGLLNAGEIPFHKTGTHRRVYLKDLLDYRSRRDQDRKRTLTELAKQDLEEGTYDPIYIPEEEC
jgi:excisionase family DNA binding protein